MLDIAARRLLVVLATVCVLASEGVAQDAVPTPAEDAQPQAAAADFSAGFEKLIGLGLPKLDPSARWVKHPPSSRNVSYQLREMVGKMSGNAWVLPASEENNMTPVLSFGGLEPMDLTKSQVPKTDADLRKDVEALITALGENTDDDVFGGGMSSFMGSQGSNGGNLLIFAAQLHQVGQTALANRLAATIFSMSPSAESVVDSAVGQLANAAYQKIITAFFNKPDFAVFHRELVELNKRFPRGWREGKALAMLMPQLAKQAAGETLPAPRIEGVELDPAALAAIAAWQRAPEKTSGRSMNVSYDGEMYYGMDTPTLWLLGPEEGGGPATGTHAALIKCGMNAIPVLAALTGDPGITVMRHQNYGGYYYSSDQSEEDLIYQIYQRMQRPATRGEIARQLLAATLPDPNDDLDEADADTIRQAAMDFWKENRAKSHDELLVFFMKNGSGEQTSHVANLLASSKSPEAHAAFEKHVLAAENPLDFIGPAKTYLSQKRAAGKSFYEAYAAKAREHAKLAGDDVRQSWEIREAGGIDKLLKSLQSLASPESPRAIARNIARGEPQEAEAAIQGLTALLETTEPAKQLEIYLEGANTTIDPGVRCMFIAATFDIPWPGEKEEEEEEKEPPPPRALTGSEAIIWRKLMADTREVPEKMRERYEAPNIGGLAASAFEYSVSPHEVRNIYRFKSVLGKSINDFLLERAKARLSGDPVPPVPDAGRVSADRLKEIVAEAARMPAAEIRSYLDKLTPDERAKWMEWFAEPGDPPMPPEFLRLKSHIVARTTGGIFENYGIKDVPEVSSLGVGFTLDSKNLKTHLESLAGDIARHSPLFILIRRSESGPGLEIFAYKMEPPAPDAAKKNEEENEGNESEDGEVSEPPHMRVMKSMFQPHAMTLAEHPEVQGIMRAAASDGEGNGKYSTWWVRDGKLTTPAEKDENSGWQGGDEDPDGLNEMLDTFLPSAESGSFYFRIECIAREHADIFKPTNE